MTRSACACKAPKTAASSVAKKDGQGGSAPLPRSPPACAAVPAAVRAVQPRSQLESRQCRAKHCQVPDRARWTQGHGAMKRRWMRQQRGPPRLPVFNLFASVIPGGDRGFRLLQAGVKVLGQTVRCLAVGDGKVEDLVGNAPQPVMAQRMPWRAAAAAAEVQALRAQAACTGGGQQAARGAGGLAQAGC